LWIGYSFTKFAAVGKWDEIDKQFGIAPVDAPNANNIMIGIPYDVDNNINTSSENNTSS